MIKKYTNGAWSELGKYRKYGTENYAVSTFPASMLTTGNDFEDYRIYGASGGAGVRTENLFDGQIQQGYYAFANGQRDTASIIAQKWVCTTLVPCNGDTAYSIRAELSPELKSRSYGVVWFDSSLNFISSNSFHTLANPVIFDAMSPSSAAYYAVNIAGTYESTLIIPSNIISITIIEGSTPPESYIPFGYKLPLLSGSTPVDIYIGDDTLSTEEYVDYGEQKVYKYIDGVLTPVDPPVALPALPTLDGTTIVDFDSTSKPDRMTAEDTGWFGYKPKIYTNGQWVDMT